MNLYPKLTSRDCRIIEQLHTVVETILGLKTNGRGNLLIRAEWASSEYVSIVVIWKRSRDRQFEKSIPIRFLRFQTQSALAESVAANLLRQYKDSIQQRKATSECSTATKS